MKKRDLSLSALLFFAYSALSSSNTYFLSLFFDNSLGFSGEKIGLIFSVRAVLTFLSGYPSGYLASRFSTSCLFRLTFLVQGVSVFLLSGTSTINQVFWTYLPYVIASELTGVLFDALFMSQAGCRQRNSSQIILMFQSAKFFGLGVGTLLTGYVLDSHKFVGLFWILATGFVLLSFCVRKGMTLVHRADDLIVQMQAHLQPGAEARSAFGLMVLSFVIALHWGAEITILPLFLQKQLGFTHSAVGWYFGLEVFSLGITTLVLTLARTDVVRKKAGLIAVSLSIFGTLGTAVSLPWLSILCRAIHGIGDAMLFGYLFGQLSRLTEDRNPAKLTGAVHAVTMMALACGSVLYPWAASEVGLNWSIALSGLAMFPALVMFRARQGGLTLHPYDKERFGSDNQFLRITASA